MQIPGSKLIGTHILGLQTGTQLAVLKNPVIDPSNLKIEAYEVDGPLLNQRPSFIRIADVRELSDIGMIIDSNDEFIGADDVIVIDKLYKLGFRLIGLNVIDEMKNKLGKVADYTVDTGSFIIQQLSVKRGVIKSITDTELLIHRSQIVEINDREIIVNATPKKLEAVPKKTLNYLNPFRQTPQAGNSNSITTKV